MRTLWLAAVAALALLSVASSPPAISGASSAQDSFTSLLRRDIKYVFILYQENRSFDSYFGTFPGADGLYSQPPEKTSGFEQPVVDLDGSIEIIRPFRIGPADYAADTSDVDHAHSRIVAKMDVIDGTARMDRFALVEERKRSPTGKPTLEAKQYGELTMAHEDCDTVPFLWRWASRFALFDHVFQEMAGPSTTGNLAIIAAQTGATQAVLHPDEIDGGNGDSGAGVPVLNDGDPLWGSPSDPNPADLRLPANADDFPRYEIQRNLTFASLPLTFEGKRLTATVRDDRMADTDLRDVHGDVAHLGASGLAQPQPWGWYEEGFDVADGDNVGPVDAAGRHASYVTHHNGPQYFGYVANNPKMTAHLFGLRAFFDALQAHSLPSTGYVAYVKGGFRNIMGLTPANPDTTVQKNFMGDDDHPAYSDAQTSEALLAKEVDAIERSPYWAHSAIIITWDDSEGDYDHVAPPSRAAFPGVGRISDGPRIPLLLISPYAKSHAIVHTGGDTASVVKLVERVFGLEPLAMLPDEARARALGAQRDGDPTLGPLDAYSGIGDLTDGFDQDRLAGRKPVISGDDAYIPETWWSPLAQNDGLGCQRAGVVPVDRARNLPNPVPSDFNPRP
jgi:phospholipase C